jgi:hypothetical protein
VIADDLAAERPEPPASVDLTAQARAAPPSQDRPRPPCKRARHAPGELHLAVPIGGAAGAVVRAATSKGEPADIFLVETRLSPERALLSVGQA